MTDAAQWPPPADEEGDDARRSAWAAPGSAPSNVSSPYDADPFASYGASSDPAPAGWTPPPKPGLIRVEADRGTAIQVEIWAVPASTFGRFVASIPPPMSIGTVRLADGRVVKGFLAEAVAVESSRDISNFGGWRAYLAQANSA